MFEYANVQGLKVEKCPTVKIEKYFLFVSDFSSHSLCGKPLSLI